MATTDDLGMLSIEELGELQRAVQAEAGRRAARELAGLVRTAVGEALHGGTDLRDARPQKVVFGAYDFDNGWFYHVNGGATLVLDDGYRVPIHLHDSPDEDLIDQLLGQLSALDAVGPTSTLTLRLDSAEVTYDTYGAA